jgi:hypothetical protein
MKKLIILLLFILLFFPGCPSDETGKEDYEGTWKGEDIFVVILGDCDIEVVLTKTNYQINLYTPGTSALVIGSNKGTHEGLTESTDSEDVWNTLTLTHEYNGAEWVETEGDEDYGAYQIDGDTMHFKYDINDDHEDINAEGDLIKQ